MQTSNIQYLNYSDSVEKTSFIWDLTQRYVLQYIVKYSLVFSKLNFKRTNIFLGGAEWATRQLLQCWADSQGLTQTSEGIVWAHKLPW